MNFAFTEEQEELRSTILRSNLPADVLTRATVERVYRWPVVLHPHAGPGRDAGAPQVVPLATDPAGSATASPTRTSSTGGVVRGP